MQAVTPRPIGFLSTVDAQGRTNLAPFSYFNIACHDPPIVMVAFTHPNGQELKGTCENILETKEFVANMYARRFALLRSLLADRTRRRISEPFVEAANFTSIDAPKGVSEWPLSGLTPVPSKLVKPARVGESAFVMECVLGARHSLSARELQRLTAFSLGRTPLPPAQRRWRPNRHRRPRPRQALPRQGRHH